MTQITALDGTQLSPLTFGTMQFGGSADARASQAMFDAARAEGITHFDCAHVYNGGEAERLLGQFARADRDSLILATKVGYTGGAGRANLVQSFDLSRQRLDADCIDILYLHRFDPDTPLEETFETLARSPGQRARPAISACRTMPPGRSSRHSRWPNASVRGSISSNRCTAL